MADGWQKKLAQAHEKGKAREHAHVEHPFHVIKNIFRHRTGCYRSIAKNDARRYVLSALSNLYWAREQLRPWWPRRRKTRRKDE